MKIYTKKGDSGETDLGGKRVSKGCNELEALGNIDELNSVIGLILSKNKNKEIAYILKTTQNDLHIVSAELSCFSDKKILDTDVQVLEKSIDEFEEKLNPLNKFILPGGSEIASLLHLARTVCRRAERNLVKINANEDLLKYVNRLGDLLFVLARYANKIANIKETNPEY